MFDICRTCARQITEDTSNFFYVDAHFKDKIYYCVPEIDLRAIPDARTCNDCYLALNVMHAFKIRCRLIEDKIDKHFKEHGFVNLSSLMQSKDCDPTIKQEINFDDDNICRTCLQFITDKSLISLNEESCYVHQLILCVPEMDLQAASIVKICTDCLAALNVSFRFKMKCLEVEEHINNYLKEHVIVDSKHLLSLSNMGIKTEKIDVKLESEEQPAIKEEELDLDNDCVVIDNSREIESKKTIAGKKQILKCAICAFTTNKKTCWVAHLLQHGIKPFRCIQCGFGTNRQKCLTVHMLSHSTEKPYRCAHCEYRCNNRSNLIKHLYIHSTNKRYQCADCDYKANYKSHLISHVLLHTNQKPFACSRCGYRSNYKSSLQNHILRHSDMKILKCIHCDFKTGLKASLKKHLVVHTGEKPFKCPHCDFGANRKANLQRHIRTHTGEKPFPCSHCAYRARRKTHLKKHVLRHTNEKMFQCPHCDYKSNYKSTFNKHVLKHASNDTFRCSDCNYVTVTKSLLKRHILSHDRCAFKCSHCDYRTKYKWSLDVHVNVHAKDNLFSCLKCTFRADNESTLKVHNARMHRKNATD